jgi:AbrB family looped-hinge helix DNA binding protein
MSIALSIDKVGRVVLPKEVRTRLHLKAGDILDAEVGVDEVRLRTRHAALAGLRKAGGRLVWDAPGATVSIAEIEAAIGRGRSERDARSAGL